MELPAFAAHALASQLRGPILDDETFEQLQVVLDAGLKFAPYRERDKPYPLSGRLIGTCGAHYSGTYRREQDRRWYVCANKRWINRETRCDDPSLGLMRSSSRFGGRCSTSSRTRTR